MAAKPGQRILNSADPDAPSGLEIARIIARRIARATEYAEREVVIGLPAMILSLLHGIAPRLTLRLMTGVNRLLPPPAEASGDTFRGREVGSPLQLTTVRGVGYTLR